jgi:hypothetical protein
MSGDKKSWNVLLVRQYQRMTIPIYNIEDSSRIIAPDRYLK